MHTRFALGMSLHGLSSTLCCSIQYCTVAVFQVAAAQAYALP
jgi:hypothetical protein